MAQAMHTDLASLGLQRAHDVLFDRVPLGHEVPGRAEAELALRTTQQLQLPETDLGLDIMSQYERPRPALGPRPEPGHRLAGRLQHFEQPAVEVVQSVLDGPAGELRPSLYPGEGPAQAQLHLPRQRRSHQVVTADGEAGDRGAQLGPLRVVVALAPQGRHDLGGGRTAAARPPPARPSRACPRQRPTRPARDASAARRRPRRAPGGRPHPPSPARRATCPRGRSG